MRIRKLPNIHSVENLLYIIYPHNRSVNDCRLSCIVHSSNSIAQAILWPYFGMYNACFQGTSTTNHFRFYSGTFLENGMDRIVDQVVNPRVYSVFLPKVEDVVRNCLKMDENNKPIFVPPPKPDLRLEAQRRSITSRARVPAPCKLRVNLSLLLKLV